MPTSQLSAEEFEQAYRSQFRHVRSICGRVAGWHVAEDLAQDVFAKAWEHREHFRRGASVPTWLAVIARNMAINHTRRKKNQPHADVVEHSESLHSPDPDALNGMIEIERDEILRTSLWRGLKSLPAQQQRMITMRFFQGMKARDIGQLERVHLSTVLRVIERGLNTIREGKKAVHDSVAA